MRTEENSSPDWDAIKDAYIWGTQSIRAIARENGLSDMAIRKRAKSEGWKSGLRRQFARELNREPPLPPKAKSLAPIIGTAANAEHGELIKENRSILELLAAELRAETVHVGWLEELVTELTAEDKDNRRYEAMMKALSLPVRILAAKNLALALKTLEDASPGKKEQANEAAKTAGEGSAWGGDLDMGGFGAN